MSKGTMMVVMAVMADRTAHAIDECFEYQRACNYECEYF